MTDEKNNTIAITPKRPVPKIEETNLSEQLHSIFPDVDQTIKQESETWWSTSFFLKKKLMI